MNLKVLVDNNTYIDQYFLGEPAASFYIECDGKKILFDTGYSDVVIKNADKMGIDLNKLDFIVISHGHDDHTRGLMFIKDEFDLSDVKLIAHPDCFLPKYFGELYIGSPLMAKEIEKISDYVPSTKPYNITENLIYLGQIPESNDFEQKHPIGCKVVNGQKEDDYITEDTAIVFKGDNGLFIITGCSHCGICNIIDYAKNVCDDDRIIGVIGGFHIFETDERLNKTIDYFVENKIKTLYPCHCVSLKAKAKMIERLNVEEVAVNLEIDV